MSRLASAGSDNKIKIWDLDFRECVFELTGPKSTIHDLKFLTSNILASGSEDTTIRIWDLSTQKLIKIFEADLGIYSLALVERNILASGCGSEGGVIYFWNLETGLCVGELKEHSYSVRMLTNVAPNILVSGCDDGTIKIWNLNEKKCIKTIETGHHWFRSLAVMRFD